MRDSWPPREVLREYLVRQGMTVRWNAIKYDDPDGEATVLVAPDSTDERDEYYDNEGWWAGAPLEQCEWPAQAIELRCRRDPGDADLVIEGRRVYVLLVESLDDDYMPDGHLEPWKQRPTGCGWSVVRHVAPLRVVA